MTAPLPCVKSTEKALAPAGRSIHVALYRGLRGRVEDGKSGGGLCFGYDVVKQFAANGEPIRGDRTINEAEATVVRRIFVDYIAGKSSRTIAFELNKDGVPGPQGAEWGPSTI
ncbi:recombinase family protein, partial [Shinella sp.]|uniref:recombinase family protein n=1 Tax=Shinella sp. TaxID=1870904 RepID=UPI0039E6F18C